MKIPNFSQARILVVGDVMLDSYWFGSTSRISPEAPVPVVHVQKKEDRPGGAGNVALNLSSLGAQVDLIGLTGDDEAANQLEDYLSKRNVSCHFIRVNDHPTINKLRVLSKNQQLMRLDFETGFNSDNEDSIATLFDELLAKSNFVILSDYGKGTLSNCADLIGKTKKANIDVLVDPKGENFSIYSGATMITPNLPEFEAVVGACDSSEEIVSKAHKLIEELKLKSILITRSSKGMLLVSKDSVVDSLPTHAKEVYDVTGAGDTVIAVLAASLAAGANKNDALRCSNTAAGVVVAKLGTATVSVAEIESALTEKQESTQKILNKQGLIEQVKKAKHKGERIVMTNGCFDVLHTGHIRYLEIAATLGSKLIVAVNSNESVKKLKGSGRPINDLEDRMEMLAALKLTDWVISFNAETPRDLICEILPDVLVKGGDYKVEEIAGGDCVSSNGGQVVSLGFVDGKSTTKMIKDIQALKLDAANSESDE